MTFSSFRSFLSNCAGSACVAINDYVGCRRHPVSTAAVPHVVVASSKSEFESLCDLIKVAKLHPNQLNFSSAGIGNAAHMAAELLNPLEGISIVNVPYARRASYWLRHRGWSTPFRVIKRQFGLARVALPWTTQEHRSRHHSICVSILWMDTHRLIKMMGMVRPKTA